jgi:hypothetical protein
LTARDERNGLPGLGIAYVVAGSKSFMHRKRIMIDGKRRTYRRFVLIRGEHEPFNRLAVNESIHNLRDVRDRNAPVKKVIGFD